MFDSLHAAANQTLFLHFRLISENFMLYNRKTKVQQDRKRELKMENIEAATIEGNNSSVIIGVTSTIGTVTMNSNDATLEVMGTVTTVLVTETAQNSTINVAENAAIESIIANSESTIQGDGTVTNVTANANVTVETQNTTVTVGENLSGILINDEEVAAGEAIVTPCPLLLL